MAMKKTYQFCYVVNRVNRIWPTYAITLGCRQHIKSGKKERKLSGWPVQVGQILLYFSKFPSCCTYPHICGPNSVILIEYQKESVVVLWKH